MLACRLTSLRTLSLQSNRLTSMVGFGSCIHLEELYLSHNGISTLEVCISALKYMFEMCWPLQHGASELFSVETP